VRDFSDIPAQPTAIGGTPEFLNKTDVSTRWTER
jgi:hypothetical protein